MHRRLLALTWALACATNDHAPVAIPPIDPTEIDAWRSYATQTWWLAGTEIPCDGVLDESWQSYTPHGLTDARSCKRADGETINWFRRGDRACPQGATLEGAPPPGAAVECMRGETNHGRYTYWRAGGSVEKSGERIDGEPTHLEVAFFPDGTLQSVVHFERGKPHGLTVRFHPNGQRAAQTRFVDGVAQGIATEWHDNGRIARQVTYRDGEIDGTVTTWDEDGRPCGPSSSVGTGNFTPDRTNCIVERTGEMNDGETVGQRRYFDPDVRPISPSTP